MPTLSQIKRENYRHFGRLSEPNRSNSIFAVQYIETLANQTGASIAHWDVEEVFKAKQNSRSLVADKNEINRRFFT